MSTRGGTQETKPERSKNARSGETSSRVWVKRHSLVVRLTHWVTALALLVLLMSGLQIFNAHPALYWGAASDFDNPLFAIQPFEGRTVALGQVLQNFAPRNIALPGWMTLPSHRSLPAGRQWHFFFAWVLVVSLALYLVHGLWRRHIQRDIWPHRADLRAIPSSIGHHFRGRFVAGTGRYNSLQKLSYALILFFVLPLIVVTGLTMSPALNAAFPFLVEMLGGRQSARTIHFVGAMILVAFTAIHIVMVVISNPLAGLWSMISGRRREAIKEESDAR